MPLTGEMKDPTTVGMDGVTVAPPIDDAPLTHLERAARSAVVPDDAGGEELNEEKKENSTIADEHKATDATKQVVEDTKDAAVVAEGGDAAETASIAATNSMTTSNEPVPISPDTEDYKKITIPPIVIPEISTCSNEEDAAAIPRTSVRESLRARLREQEKRLSTLVRNTSGDGSESFLTKIKTVQENLKQMEQEKSQLEEELSRLKNATEDDDFLKEKMTSIQEGFDKQVKKIQSLQHEIGSKNNEIDMLRTELVKKLKKIVELEFDLQTHEVHYTEYAEEQFKLGEAALAEIKSLKKSSEEKDDDNMSVVSFKSTAGPLRASDAQTPKKAQKLISKLLADLDNLEMRFKEEKLMSSAMIEKLTLTNSDLQTKTEILEQRLKQSFTGDNARSETKEPESFEMQNAAFLRRRVEALEAKKSLAMRECDKLRAQLDESKQEADSDAKRHQFEVRRLESENQALKVHLQQLDSNKGRRRKSVVDQATEQYAAIGKQIKDTYEKITRLQNSVEIKDRQISTLKKEVANLRLREISEGRVQGTSFSRMDTDILRASSSVLFINQHRPSFYNTSNQLLEDGEGGGNRMSDDTHAYIAELQKQLQEAQQQIVKKDQELVIERAKAASTAAGLLARITELTGQKVDASSKHVPRRFYL